MPLVMFTAAGCVVEILAKGSYLDVFILLVCSKFGSLCVKCIIKDFWICGACGLKTLYGSASSLESPPPPTSSNVYTTSSI